MALAARKYYRWVEFGFVAMIVFFFFSVNTALADDPLHVFYTGAPGFNIDNSLTGVGDINFDGRGDYLVGAPELSVDGKTGNGAVYLVSGADGSQLAIFAGETSGEQFGFSLACAGDLNGDGVNDFLIAARYAFGGAGGVFVYSGGDGILLYGLPAPDPSSGFGESMVSLGDKDGDGAPEIAIAAPAAYGDDRGEVYLYSGAQGGVILDAWTGEASQNFFGKGLAVADLDGNGSLDLVISAPYRSNATAPQSGTVYWVSNGIGTPPAILAEGETSYQGLGVKIVAVDDINDDGIKDIAALDVNGQVYLFSGVYSGAPLGFFSLGLEINEYAESLKIVAISDYNGDGHGDLLVGRPEAEEFAGVAQIISAIDGSLLKTYNGPLPGCRFGSQAAAVADLDGNGLPDLLVGADFIEPPGGGPYVAAVFVYPGGGGLAPQNDVDGDGMADDWEASHGLNPADPLDAGLDFDNDGLTNLGEYEHGTDPNNPDGDFDGLFDGWEVDHGLNPNLETDAWEDPDGDELLNIDEFFAGTDPHNSDSDGDTLPDGWELFNGLIPNFADDAGFDNDGDGLSNLQEYAAGTNPLQADTDSDGISDGDEISRGLNPLSADSDGDGIHDGWEDQNGLNPLDGADGQADLDGDGLDNLGEFQAGSNPASSDTDGDTLADGDEVHTHQTDPVLFDTDEDGLSDGAEVSLYSTNPLAADSDGDLLPDGAEVHTYNTDPLDTDTDDDGMPDGWELGQSFDPNNAGDATLDADNDGATNLEEYQARTDPYNSVQYPGGPGSLQWSFQAGNNVSTASVAPDGTVYISSRDGNLYAFNPDGTQKWEYNAGYALTTGPTIGEDGTIYVASASKLFSIYPDGSLKWDSDFSVGLFCGYALALAQDGTVYLPVRDRLIAFNPDGTQKWIASTDGSQTSGPAVASDGTVYVKSWGGKLYAFNPDGTRKWVYSMGGSGFFVYESPAIGADGTIYIGDDYHYLRAINPDGTQKWSCSLPAGTNATVAIAADGTIYASGTYLSAVAADGTLLWYISLGASGGAAPAIGADGTVYVGGSDDSQPVVFAMNPDGRLKWRYETGDGGYLNTASIIGQDGTLYLGTMSSNRFYAINTASDGPALSSWPMAGHDLRHTGNIEALPPNSPPTLTITAPADGSAFSEDDGAIGFDALADDPEDGDVSAGIQWRSNIDGDFVPPVALSVGTHTITASVSDSDGLTSNDSITVTVEAHVNTAPTIAILTPLDGAILFVEDGEFVFSGSASDMEDGDISLNISWTSNLDGPFTSPAALSRGTHLITANVSDSGGLNSSVTANVVVTSRMNATPTVTITAPANGADIHESNGAIGFSGTAFDPEDGDLSSSLQWTSSLDGVIMSPAALSIGTHIITASAADSDGLIGSDAIQLIVYDDSSIDLAVSGQVLNGNVIQPQSKFTLNIGVSNFSPTGADIDNVQVKIYLPDGFKKAAPTCTAMPNTCGFNSLFMYCNIPTIESFVSQSIQVLPETSLLPGQYSITAIATSSGNDVNPGNNIIEIPIIVNNPPAISISYPEDGFEALSGELLNFTATAIDIEDGDSSANVQWHSNLDGAFTPPAILSAGAHTVTASVTDSAGSTAVATITVTVQVPANQAPQVTIIVPLDEATVYRNNWPVAFSAGAVDPEQGDISADIQWSSSLDGAFTPPATLSAGTHVITASVADSQGLTGTAEFTLHVLESGNDVMGYEQFIETGKAGDIGSQDWTTVRLAGVYDSMVVVCTPVYDNNAPPMVARIRNATGGSFQLKLDRADGRTEAVTGVEVFYIVVEEGVYSETEHGITMEAVRVDATATDRKGSWSGQTQSYANAYTNPVVFGQVMTYNDPGFSVFWSCAASNGNPASSSAIKVGKHVGEDPGVVRNAETIGYIVIESASGTIGDLVFTAGLGSDIVTGMPKGTKPGISYGFSGIPEPMGAILSQAAMDGGDGGWSILYGADPIASNAISLVIDEDQMYDAERNHTTEQVSYLVFGR